MCDILGQEVERQNGLTVSALTIYIFHLNLYLHRSRAGRRSLCIHTPATGLGPGALRSLAALKVLTRATYSTIPFLGIICGSSRAWDDEGEDLDDGRDAGCGNHDLQERESVIAVVVYIG